MLPQWGIQICQVLALLVFAPLISGVIAKVEARVQWRIGPSILQPYYDIAKFFRKESLRPETASPFFELAPLIAFASYCSIALLIPVLFADHVGRGQQALGGALYLDGLSGVFLASVAFVYAVVAVYSVGYMRPEVGHVRLRRPYWPLLNLFGLALLATPIVANLGVLWVAVELTTLSARCWSPPRALMRHWRRRSTS